MKGRGIQSVEVGHRLLAALVEAEKPMILRDLAAAARLAPAQAHAYLSSFRRIDLVEQHPISGRYSLGSFAMRLGMARIRGSTLLSQASEKAADLSRQLGLMVCVVVWGPQAPTVIQVHGAHTLDLNIREGTVFSITRSASGRLYGALSNADVVKQRIKDELAGTLVQGVGERHSEKGLKKEFAAIRANRITTSVGQPVPGVNSAAAPVFDRADNLSLVLALIGSEAKLTLAKEDPAPLLLKSVAQSLSKSAIADIATRWTAPTGAVGAVS